MFFSPVLAVGFAVYGDASLSTLVVTFASESVNVVERFLDARQFLSGEVLFFLRAVVFVVFCVARDFFHFALRFSEQIFAVLFERFAALVCGDGFFEFCGALL